MVFPPFSRLQIVRACVLAAAALVSGSAFALSFTSFDARSLGLGGAGVANARPDEAMYFNPALLSVDPAGSDHRLSVSLDVGARLVDRDGFIHGVRHYQDHDADKVFAAALADFNDRVAQQTLSLEDFDRLDSASNNLFDDIEGLSNRPLRVGAAIGISVARPGRTGIAGFTRRYAIGGGVVNFAAEDRASISSAIDFGRSTFELTSLFDDYVQFLRDNAASLESSYADGGFGALEQNLRGLLAQSELADNTEGLVSILRSYHDAYLAGATDIQGIESFSRLPGFDQNLKTSIELQGAVITEYGVSFSRRLGTARGLSIGASIKGVQFDTFDYEGLVNTAESEAFSYRDHRRPYSDLNVDVGMTATLKRNLHWGLTARNLIARRYRTVRGNVIELKPVVRAGIAWQRERLTVAADLDLTRNEPLGFDADRRFLAVGVERRWARWSLRGGVRHNLVDGVQLYSLGTAVRLGRAEIALSAAVAKDTIASALRFAFEF